MNVRKVLNWQFRAVNIVSNTTNPVLTTFQLVTRFFNSFIVNFMSEVTVIINERKQK